MLSTNQPIMGWSIVQQHIDILCIYLQDSILLHSKLTQTKEGLLSSSM